MECKLRPWTIEDLDRVTGMSAGKQITDFMSDGFPDSRDKWKAFLEKVIGNKAILYYAIEVNGSAVGGIGISPQKEEMNNSAELGYWLAEEYWGKGIMSKAVREIVEQAFKKFDINRILAKPYSSNPASHRVLEKAGFKLESRLEKAIIRNGELLDQLLYAVRKE